MRSLRPGRRRARRPTVATARRRSELCRAQPARQGCSAVTGIRFSVQIPDAPDRRTWVEKVRRAEASGFFSVSVPDHLGMSLPQLAPVAALAVAAEASTRLRLAVTVFDNDFRHPVMLAKEV